MRRTLVGLLLGVSVAVGLVSPVRAESTISATHYPVVTGAFAVGNTLQVTSGTWADGDQPLTVDLAFQWYVGEDAAAGATEQTFTIPKSAVGKQVSVQVTASSDGYQPTTVTAVQMASTKSDVGTVARRGGCPTMSRASHLAHVGMTAPTKVFVVYCGKPWAVADVLVGKGLHAYDALSVYHFAKGRWTAYDRQKTTCPSDNNALWFSCNVD